MIITACGEAYITKEGVYVVPINLLNNFLQIRQTPEQNSLKLRNKIASNYRISLYNGKFL